MTRSIILGVGGGVAAYKTSQLASQLVQRHHQVAVVLTAAARHFVGEAALAALTNRPVCTNLFDHAYPLGAHIELADQGELLCVAPATADLMAKFSLGLADDLLTTLYLAFEGPVLVAPAMNTAMWEKPAVQRAVEQLQLDGVHVIPPQEGWLSCRRQGAGRMEEPDGIVESIEQHLLRLT